MGTTGNQQVTPPRAKTTPAQKQVTPVDTRALREDTFAASKAYLDHVTRDRPYLKTAFANPYNLSLFLGGLAAAGVTFSPFLAVIVVCLEALWLVFAPGSKLLQKLLWDPQFDEAQKAQAQAARAARVEALTEYDRARVRALVARQEEINRLAAQNPSFTGELLRTELGKTDRLVESFIDMAITCGRYEQYLESVDLAEVERSRQRWERVAQKGAKDDEETNIARKNLAVIMKRLDKMKEIHHYLMVARGQLDLIENSFQLIADQIVTMQSPQELTGQLDELLDGVESIKETAADTERLLNPLGMTDLPA
jgi:chemotaxis protein histidine kinase CheA